MHWLSSQNVPSGHLQCLEPASEDDPEGQLSQISCFQYFPAGQEQKVLSELERIDGGHLEQ